MAGDVAVRGAGRARSSGCVPAALHAQPVLSIMLCMSPAQP
jgi:hypothetical protein